MNYRKFVPGAVRLLLAASLVASILVAAEHHGTVKFASLPVPGATVTLTQGDKKMTAVTDLDGIYGFADVPDGVWNLDIEMLGFQPLKQEIAVAPGAPSPQWELKMKTIDEIKAGAPAPSADTGTVLPVTTSPAAASITTPGAPAAAPTANPSIAAADTNAAANNKKSNSKNSKNAKNAKNAVPQQQGQFQRTDVNASAGAPAANDTAPPSIAGVAEAQAQNASDALVVNGSQSSGIERRVLGNNRRGPASLYRLGLFTTLDNSYLDAKQYSLTGQNTYKPATNHINSGIDVGGPLYIPHILRSSGQVFLSYQFARNRNSTVVTDTMPTAAELTGNFNGVLNALGQPVIVNDPNTGQPFPNNVIPQNRLSTQALALAKYYPTPNFIPTAGYNYQIATTGRNDSDSVNTRFNRNLNQKNFINGGYNYNNTRGDNTNPYVNPFGFIDNSQSVGMNANFSYRHVFSPRLNVSTSVNWSRQSSEQEPFFANRTNVSGLAGITGNDQEPLYWGPPSLGFNGGSTITGLSDGTPSTIHNQTTGFGVDGLWVHRPHNIHFVADVRRQQFNNISQANPRGGFGFTGALTGYDFADFLLGVPSTSNISFGNADKYFRSWMEDAGVTDDWRVGPGFSINAGIRWEYGSPPVEKYGRLVNLDIAPGYSAVAPVIGSSPKGSLTNRSYPDSLVNPYKHAFQPRLSIAWRPIFGDSLIVRASYGVYYDTSLYQGIATRMAQQSPLSKSLNVQNSPADPLTLASGFNASPNLTTNNFAVAQNFRPGYSQNWNVSAQRDLPGGMILNLSYLGVKGTHEQQVFAPNTFPSPALDFCPGCPVGYSYLVSGANSTSQIGQIQLRRRLHNGLTAGISYKFQKALDDAAALGGRSSGGSLLAQNWLDLEGERGPSSFDQRHNVQLQFQYTSGMGLKGGTLLSGWRGAAIKGWSIVTTINMGTGLPLNPSCSACLAPGTAFNNVRPDYVGGDIYSGLPGYNLNLLAYTAPVGTWGTAGRNTIVGPAQFSMTSSAARSFGKVDLRLDSTNAINHVTFGSWQTNISSPLFGLVANPNAMRDVRLTLRMRF